MCGNNFTPNTPPCCAKNLSSVFLLHIHITTHTREEISIPVFVFERKTIEKEMLSLCVHICGCLCMFRRKKCFKQVFMQAFHTNTVEDDDKSKVNRHRDALTFITLENSICISLFLYRTFLFTIHKDTRFKILRSNNAVHIS